MILLTVGALIAGLLSANSRTGEWVTRMSEISRAIYDEHREQQAAKAESGEMVDAIVDRVERLVRTALEGRLTELRRDLDDLDYRLGNDEISEDEYGESHHATECIVDGVGLVAKSLDLKIDTKGWTI